MANATSLDRSMARAIAWNAAARWLAQIFSWASTIVVARLLSPYDYGLVGMAGLYLNLAMMVGTGGLGDAIVVFRDLTTEQVSQLNTVSVLTGFGLIALSLALAYPLSWFFAAPPLASIILVSSVWYIIGSLQVVPKGLLQKELRFKLLAVVETARAFFQAFMTIVFALLHFRYWSLVIGYLSGSAVASMLTLYWKRQGFAWPRFRQLWSEIKYGIHLISSRVALYAYDNADFGVAGRVLGEVPLGNYTVAWTISSAPVEKIANLVTGVTPAYFSAVQKDQAELRRYLLRITETLSFITLPASIGLALCAEFLVPVLLGSKWNGAVGPLRLLGIFVAARSITTILPNLL
ncbi:MAG TPA: oligosaccharide flippase family protein, partial [Candidatus Polarisedimenticolia bacterium]|nr:oligosaccharide flippase family protein [Candidatus Polarisedimenticolia bacterium]